MHSNCLFEAIKAKIKDPKNVSIIAIPKVLNQGHIHFMWRNKLDNTVHHYRSNENDEQSSHKCFNGVYKTLSFEAFEMWVLYRLYRLRSSVENKVKIAKKLDLKIIKIPGVLECKSYFPSIECLQIDDEDEWIYEGELPQLEDVEYLKKVLRHSIQLKVYIGKKLRTMTIDKALKVKRNRGIGWKYITVFDQDYSSIMDTYTRKNLWCPNVDF